MGTLEATPDRSFRAALAERARNADWLPLWEATKVVLAVRGVFFALAYVGTWMFSTDTTGPPKDGFLDIWTRWDALHFVNIAKHGYLGPQSDTHSTAFFPLFPLLERALGALGLNLALAGMVIVTIATIVAGTYMYRLAEEEIGEGCGRRAVLYMSLFPTAVFLVAPYTEPLFLAGAVPAFYYARRGRWLAVGIPAAVAVGARAAGIFLLAGLAVEFIRQRKFELDNTLNALTGILLGGIPLLAYGVFLARAAGDPFHFLTSQRLGWGRDFVGPLASFLNTWRTWNSSYFTNWMFAWRLEIVAALVGAALVLWVLLKREWGYATYMALGLAALVTSSWYYSIPRMLLTWFPVILLLVGFTKNDPRRHEFALLMLAPVACLGVLVYTRNIWFF